MKRSREMFGITTEHVFYAGQLYAHGIHAANVSPFIFPHILQLDFMYHVTVSMYVSFSV